jgi:hypothetical protein
MDAPFLAHDVLTAGRKRMMEVVLTVLGRDADALVSALSESETPEDVGAYMDTVTAFLGGKPQFARTVMLGLVRTLPDDQIPMFWRVLDTGELPVDWAEVPFTILTDISIAHALRGSGIRRCTHASASTLGCTFGANARSAMKIKPTVARMLTQAAKTAAAKTATLAVTPPKGSFDRA